MKRLAVISAAIISSLSLTAVASAQYPPPEAVPVVSVSNPTPTTNSIVTITWSIQGAQSALPPGGGSLRQGLLTIGLQVRSAAACQPAIASQPGTDASVRTINEIVNADGTGVGTAELNTGSTPGPIIVRISCQSGATADVTVIVQGARSSTSGPPAGGSTTSGPPAGGPPAGGPTTGGSMAPLPPKTGSFGDGEGDSSSNAILVGVLGILAVSSFAVGGRLLTRKR